MPDGLLGFLKQAGPLLRVIEAVNIAKIIQTVFTNF